MRRVEILAGVTALLCLVAAAEEEAAEKTPERDPPKRSVRFLPVGEAPPFRQEIRNGVRYEIAPPEGSLPPQNVVVGVSEKETETLALRLRGISNPVKIPEGARPLVLSEAGDGGNAKPWHRINLPEKGDVLAVLWRETKAGTWSDVRSLVLRHDRQSVPAGTVLVVNVSPVTLAVVLGKDRFPVPPGKSVRKKIGVVDGLPLQVGYQREGTFQRFYSTGLVQNPRERSTLVVFLADGKEPRRPLKVTTIREKVR